LKRIAAAKRRPKAAVKKAAKKRGPGRPRKKVAKKVAKRGPGRPPKKRGPGRPRKETTVKRGPGRPRKRPGITASDFAAIKQMIIRREHALMAAAGDHSKAYQLATEIDGFVEKLIKKVTG
jgi:hypothetical protein